MIVALAVAFGVSSLVSIVSSSSMELMWCYLNIVQLISFIPLLSLKFTTILPLMLSYLTLSNMQINIV